ncbi:MAG: hypothetical protein ACRDQ4_13815 [Pseudonocardiaceae bacterium]
MKTNIVKKQQMRWTPRGAHLLIQIRTRVLNDQLAGDFRRTRASHELRIPQCSPCSLPQNVSLSPTGPAHTPTISTVNDATICTLSGGQHPSHRAWQPREWATGTSPAWISSRRWWTRPGPWGFFVQVVLPGLHARRIYLHDDDLGTRISTPDGEHRWPTA